jgi:hypothetical protein
MALPLVPLARKVGALMTSPHPRPWSLVLAAFLLATVPVGTVSAAVRVTEADAYAALRSADSRADFEASIYPFQEEGRHYCALDWHVAKIAFVDGGDRSFTKTDAEASLNAISATFILDGAVLATERTKIKRYHDAASFDFEIAYYFQEGRVLAPADLAVGQHTLGVSVTDPKYGDFDVSTTFFIDAAGTGACL